MRLTARGLEAFLFMVTHKDRDWKVMIDVDGCLTDGQFIWTESGRKFGKMFGADDADALKELAKVMPVELVTADLKGWDIASTRAHHMGLVLEHRFARGRAGPSTIYIGDGYHDAENMREAAFGIAPRDAWAPTRRAADAVTRGTGGHRAVAEAADFIRRWFT